MKGTSGPKQTLYRAVESWLELACADTLTNLCARVLAAQAKTLCRSTHAKLVNNHHTCGGEVAVPAWICVQTHNHHTCNGEICCAKNTQYPTPQIRVSRSSTLLLPAELYAQRQIVAFQKFPPISFQVAALDRPLEEVTLR